jgi:hypothetical protein
VLGVLLGSLTFARRTAPGTAGLGTDAAPAV